MAVWAMVNVAAQTRLFFIPPLSGVKQSPGLGPRVFAEAFSRTFSKRTTASFHTVEYINFIFQMVFGIGCPIGRVIPDILADPIMGFGITYDVVVIITLPYFFNSILPDRVDLFCCLIFEICHDVSQRRGFHGWFSRVGCIRRGAVIAPLSIGAIRHRIGAG